MACTVIRLEDYIIDTTIIINKRQLDYPNTRWLFQQRITQTRSRSSSSSWRSKWKDEEACQPFAFTTQPANNHEIFNNYTPLPMLKIHAYVSVQTQETGNTLDHLQWTHARERKKSAGICCVEDDESHFHPLISAPETHDDVDCTGCQEQQPCGFIIALWNHFTMMHVDYNIRNNEYHHQHHPIHINYSRVNQTTMR